MIALSPHTIIRPEPDGAMLFQQQTAETALLDLQGLDALYFLLKGEERDYPLFFAHYLRDRRFVVPGPPAGSTRLTGAGSAGLTGAGSTRLTGAGSTGLTGAGSTGLTGAGSLAVVEAVRDAAPTTTAPPRSLSAPETIHFSVTGRCDQACAGCFYSARPGSEVPAADAPWALFERVVRDAERARVFQIALGGGEPLLHPRLVDMVRLARRHRLVPNLTTNGNRLTREVAEALESAGLGQVQISLNGVDEATNAATRPNFGAARQAIEHCRAAGLRWGLNFLVTRSNLAELEPVVTLGQRLGAASVNLLRPKPPTTEGDWLQRESPTASDYRAVQKALGKWQEAGGRRQGAGGGGQVATRITLDASLTFLLTGHPPDHLYRSGIWGCCAARKFVTVVQDGAVLPCSHVRWSDVGEGDFVRAWRESAVFARFRGQEEDMRGPCRACAYVELCKGCRAVVMAFGGGFGDSDPHCPRHGD